VQRNPPEIHSTNQLTVESRPAIFNYMVELQTPQQAPQLDNVFHALGDATRRRMLAQPGAAASSTVGELAEPFADVAGGGVQARQGAGRPPG
jgi:hypothetical protein